MEGLKGLAEVLDHILYELLALLIPGAAFVLLVAWLLGPGAWADATGFMREQVWVALGAAYLLGYAVQGVSRPVVGAVERALRLPSRLLWRLACTLAPGQRERIAGWGMEIERALLGRHTHGDAAVPARAAVDLDEVARERWRKRLRLPEDKMLSVAQARNLSFSALLSERGRLDRFRAATSLCRGVAAGVAIGLVIVTTQLVTGHRAPSLGGFLLLEGLVIAFYALLERADMYDRMWHRVIQPQFLAFATRADAAASVNADQDPTV